MSFQPAAVVSVFAFGVLGLAACYAPLQDLHPKAAKDFSCAENKIEAKPVKFGSTHRMSVTGCGQKAVYRYDDEWVREPETTSASLPAK